jgi:hypothetical protein
MEKSEQYNWNEHGSEGKEVHPPPELLMLAMDGELAPEESGPIEAHLAACWVCRTHTTKIEATITDFIEYHQTMLTPHLPPPPNTWRDFHKRLDHWAEEIGQLSWMTRLGLRLRELFALRMTAWRFAVSVAALFVMVFIFWMTRSSVVSAQELLQRSIQSETTRIKQVAEPVLYRKLHVRRKASGKEESIAWESWQGAKDNLFRQRVADEQGERFLPPDPKSSPALLAELAQVLQMNHWNGQQPLSAAAYADWRKSVRLATETVAELSLPDQRVGLKLTSVVAGPQSPDTILEASLIVRRADWAPVALHFKVQGPNEAREYELTETAYEVMPLAALTAFAGPSPLPTAKPGVAASPVSGSSLPPAASPLPTGKPTPTVAEIQQAEIAAIYTLHQMRADLGEQLEVVRNPSGQVIVQGLVETGERKEELLTALQRIPLVATQIQTVEEAQRSAAQKPAAVTYPPPANADASSTEPKAQPQLFRAALERFFASSGATSPQIAERLTALTNQSLAFSESALTRAWALRRLAENPAFKNTEQLAPKARTRLLAMLASHRQALREQMRGLRQELAPGLTFVAGGSGREAVAESAADWATAAQQVFQAVSQLDRLLHRALSSNGAITTPAQVAREALTALATAEAALQQLETQTGRLSADK